jgi:DNA repair photolyase
MIEHAVTWRCRHLWNAECRRAVARGCEQPRSPSDTCVTKPAEVHQQQRAERPFCASKLRCALGSSNADFRFSPPKQRKEKMKNKRVVVPSLLKVVQPSPGFEKKKLAEVKVDGMACCGFGCLYCSSNRGNYLRINGERFADITEQYLGERLYPHTAPELTLEFSDPVGQLARELSKRKKAFDEGLTLVYSMLTDGFSPNLLKTGVTKGLLELLVNETPVRIRVLTKSAAVGTPEWISFFKRYPERFVVGLSTGTIDDDWAKRVEIGTSSPSARLRALARLQEAGVPTYGMLCPVFYDLLESGQLERLIDAVNPAACEHIWAEPFNDRGNWKIVRDSYPTNSPGYAWFTEAFEKRDSQLWSEYALELYQRLRTKAEREGWLHKLRYLLYEHHVTADVAPVFGDLKGILLQSKPGDDGLSAHPGFRAAQLRNRSK